MSETKTLQTYFSINEIAEYLSLSAITIYRAVESGRMKAVKAGRVWRIRKEWADSFLLPQE